MKSTPSFRAVSQSEGEALASIRIKAMRESLERIGRFDEARARARFLSGFVPADTKAIVVAGNLAGFFVVRQEAGGLLLDHLYINPPFFRGKASALRFSRRSSLRLMQPNRRLG